jgi:hypothetical protein
MEDPFYYVYDAYYEDKSAMRQEIAELTEDFLSNGGEITYLPPAHDSASFPLHYVI